MESIWTVLKRGRLLHRQGAVAGRAVKRIVCLASSRMPRGLCIAGREWRVDGLPGPWVRPVTGRANEGVAVEECLYDDGRTPRLLDIMDVPVLNAQPKDHQHENWLLDPKRPWVKIGSIDRSDLPKYHNISICLPLMNRVPLLE